MNPLTLVKRTQKITARESALGISEEASWHAKYKDSAYVFVGGIPFDLTEGDLLAVFAQYGEIVDVNLVRDKGTGKSKGFAFIAYEDQRSTILAVDNLNGAQVLGRIIRVDHVSNYKKKEEEDEETERQKREERGVCRAFQRGQCTRGDGCKFSHDEQRAANTGWGHQDKEPRWGPQDNETRWGHDKFEGSKKVEKRSDDIPTSRVQAPRGQEAFKSTETGSSYRVKGKDHAGAQSCHVETDRSEKCSRKRYHVDPHDSRSRENRDYRGDKRSERHDGEESELKSRENRDKMDEKRSKWRENYDIQPRSTRDRDRKEERKEDKTFRRRDDSDHKMMSREGRDGREDMRIERLDGDCHSRKEEKRVRRYDDDDGRMLKSSEDYGKRDKGSRRH